MKRRIIKIDAEKCNGCGLCVEACHEGAIVMLDGKAVLTREDYCDGLGDCLPTCPTGAISFIEKETLAYDEKAVQENKRKKEAVLPCGCPGTHARELQKGIASDYIVSAQASQLRQWPVQIKLVPVEADYFNQSNLLIAADCTAYAYANFHHEMMKGKITLIGCPRLDMTDYTEKLEQIIRLNNIKSVTVVRMEVPCCGGLEYAVTQAIKNSGKFFPWQVITISVDGNIIN